jgi:hypothetical protein
VRGYRATPEPVRVDIPSIGVSSSLARLGRAPNGTVEVPKAFEVAGWCNRTRSTLPTRRAAPTRS